MASLRHVWYRSMWMIIGLCVIGGDYWGVSYAKHEKSTFSEVHTKLPFVESHKLSDGTIVDCVKVEDQLTLQHPNFKDHILQKPPSIRLDEFGAGSVAQIRQVFQEEVGSCPHGTIPIQRTKDKTSRKFKKDRMQQDEQLMSTTFATTNSTVDGRRVYAIAYNIGEYMGGLSHISAWNVQPGTNEDDFMLSRLRLSSTKENIVNSIEVGWHVYPLLYDDETSSLPRFFIYWNDGNDADEVCYNLLCPGFVQTNSQILLGGAFSNTADLDGKVMLVFIGKSTLDGDWWLHINDVEVGYWPANLFTLGVLRDEAATHIHWGGEVYLSAPNSTIQMGNGEYGSAITRNGSDAKPPAYHASLSYYTSDLDGNEATLVKVDPSSLLITETIPSLYDTKLVIANEDKPDVFKGTWLFFGGPGGNGTAGAAMV